MIATLLQQCNAVELLVLKQRRRNYDHCSEETLDTMNLILTHIEFVWQFTTNMAALVEENELDVEGTRKEIDTLDRQAGNIRLFLLDKKHEKMTVEGLRTFIGLLEVGSVLLSLCKQVCAALGNEDYSVLRPQDTAKVKDIDDVL